MVKKRERYIAAGFITAIIFLLGFTIGLVIEGKRVTFVQDQLQEQKVEFSSSQLQYAYLNSLESKESCPVVFKSFYDNLVRLDTTRLRLESYILDNTISETAFNLLKREYTLEQIRYWLLSKQVKDLCEQPFVPIVYFYSDKEICPDCDEQETVLLYYKALLGQNVLIFGLDSQFAEEPMIGLLMQEYGIETYPSILVGEDLLEGYVNKEELAGVLCESYEKYQVTNEEIVALCA